MVVGWVTRGKSRSVFRCVLSSGRITRDSEKANSSGRQSGSGNGKRALVPAIHWTNRQLVEAPALWDDCALSGKHFIRRIDVILAPVRGPGARQLQWPAITRRFQATHSAKKRLARRNRRIRPPLQAYTAMTHAAALRRKTASAG